MVAVGKGGDGRDEDETSEHEMRGKSLSDTRYRYDGRFQSGEPIGEKSYSIQTGDVESTVTIRQKRKIGLGGFPAYKRYFSYKTKSIEPLEEIIITGLFVGGKS